MVKTFDFELITPDGILIQEKLSELFAVTEAGEIGILPNHANLKSKLNSAPMRYQLVQGDKDIVAVLGGVIEVNNNKVTVLTDFAEKSTDINEAEAHQAAEKAKAEFQTLNPDAPKADRDLILAEAKLQRELLRLQTIQLKKAQGSGL